MKHLLLVLIVASAIGTGCRGDAPAEPEGPATPTAPPTPTNTVLTAAREAGLSTFETTVVAASLDDRLHGEGPFTVFGPSNAAFERLGETALDTLLDDSNRDRLAELVLYHVVAGRLESSTVDGPMTFESLQGGAITVERTGEGVFVSDPSGTRARVVTPDLNRGNGTLHVIDAVLAPPVVADTTG